MASGIKGSRLKLQERKYFLLFLLLFLLSSILFISRAFAQTPEEIYERALHSYKKGDYKKASVHLEEYVKIKPEPAAYYLLGYSYYKLRKFKEAEKAFHEAYLIDPELVPSKIFLHEEGKENKKDDQPGQ